MKKINLFLMITALFIINEALAQDCVNCNNPGSSGTGIYAGKLGLDNTASGDYSFSGGLNSIAGSELSFAFGEEAEALGAHSFALGYHAKALDMYSMAIGVSDTASGVGAIAIGGNNNASGMGSMIFGAMLQGAGTRSFVIGTGGGGYPAKKLRNGYSETLMIGFNSTKPTIFVSTSPSNPQYNLTGRVGIGNMTAPEAKLHILSDEDEAATLFLQPSNWNAAYKASLWMGNENNGITADIDKGLLFDSEHNFIFNSGNVGISTESPTATLDVAGSLRVRSLAGEGERVVITDSAGNLSANSFYDQCVNCGNTVNSGSNSSAIGTNTKSTGNSSFASGFGSEATANYTTALGFFAEATYTKGVAIGSAVKATMDRSVVIGSGSYSANYYLENPIPRSLMVGFSSEKPTLFISESPMSAYNDKTGKIGIGNITQPEAKLHILSDEDEAATLFLQPSNWNTTDNAEIWLGNQNHGIAADVDEGMVYQTENNHVFKNGDVYIEDINKGIIMKSPDGKCWRGQLDNNGMLNFTVLENCPGVVNSAPENTLEKSDGKVKVYPNPGTSILTVQTKVHPSLFELYNTNGQNVLKRHMNEAVNRINTNQLPAGFYTWTVTKDGKVIGNGKWIKTLDIE